MKRGIRLGLVAIIGNLLPAGCKPAAPRPAHEVILDNTDAACAVLAGDWGTASRTDGNGSYGPDFLFHLANQTNVGVVRFTPNLPTAGSYDVYVYWSADPNRTTNQPIIVHHAAGDTPYYVNLQENGNRWFELGHHTFSAGNAGYIEINTNTAAGYCNADAVRLVSDF